MPAVYTVIYKTDDNAMNGGKQDPNNAMQGDIRYAISQALTCPDTINSIQFNIPGDGVHTVSLTAMLPEIDGFGLNIDATTQPGWVLSPLVELDGSKIQDESADGFRLVNGTTSIRGFSIVGFSDNGIEL